MRSQTVSSFWAKYQSLPENTKEATRKAYRLWQKNPSHPSLNRSALQKVLIDKSV
jgi:hypothetical protein